MLRQAFDDHAVGQKQPYNWYMHFKSRQPSLDDDKYSGCPLTINMPQNLVKVYEIILQDWWFCLEDVHCTTFEKCRQKSKNHVLCLDIGSGIR